MSVQTRRRWVDKLKPGDVVLFRSGKLRTVLDVSRDEHGRTMHVTFPILRCSWTKRGHTIINHSELYVRARGIRGKCKLTKIMRRMVRDLDDPRSRYVACCEVVGIVE